uniref:NADH-ubiquinone oxidoreductase chain 3 n=1 Tax=Ornithodoros hermsi TaxID=303297 RepID=A0A3G2K018_9ACAR|nr:NADH dehydrogenase subunit 3 [Ornithodoros hermsi]AYN50643.1 NADH dehydrogenase subunit 3 [Ornithodoros hermsi]
MKFLLISTSITIFIYILGNLIKSKNFTKKEKNSPFECGFDPFSIARAPFSLRFFMISIIFLIFDVEIVILLPFPMYMSIYKTHTTILMMMIIITIFVGLIYEWKNGMIKWLS